MEIIIAVIVVLVLAAVAIGVLAAMKSKRREHLKSRFGSEYDRTIEDADSTRDAERDLAERESAHDELDLRDLSPAETSRYQDQWDTVQAGFVDRPDTAVRDADHLVGNVMRDRGYPVDDFDQKADLVSVDHPDVVSHYRSAHDISVRSDRGDATTEDQREAFVHYRALFDELLDRDDRNDDREVDHV